jgi:hypothetical protein
MKKIINELFIILLIGTIFAWANFIYEFVVWIGGKANVFSCLPNSVNPFLTPCFYGALMFSIAFILTIILKRKYKKTIRA